MPTAPGPTALARAWPRAWLRLGGWLAVVLLLACCLGGSMGASAPQGDIFQVAYEEPEDPAAKGVHDELKAARTLEAVREFLRVVRLPRPVRLAFADCGDDYNAFYDPDTSTISVCYGLVGDLRRLAAGPSRPAGVTPESAVRSSLAYIFLHEAAHALFDQLQTPILGREEDAADILATVVVLQLDDQDVREMVMGVAWLYTQEGGDVAADANGYLSDVHLLPEQRKFNLVCLAHGARPALFADALASGYLTADRAESCQEEYRLASYSIAALVGPYLDVGPAGTELSARVAMRPTRH
jgi:hypothetical protein